MQKPEIDARLILCLLLCAWYWALPGRCASQTGFTSKIGTHLLGHVQLYVTRDKAKVFVENTRMSYVGDAEGKVVVYSDLTKRRHDTTIRDFFPPGQKTNLMVSGLDMRRLPLDLAATKPSHRGSLQTVVYPIAEAFLKAEMEESRRSGIRRYRVKSGDYEVYATMTVSRNVIAFIQTFFGLPEKPRAIPIAFKYIDCKDIERPWLHTISSRCETVPARVFALPDYQRVASAHSVQADDAVDQSTVDCFDALGKFIHK